MSPLSIIFYNDRFRDFIYLLLVIGLHANALDFTTSATSLRQSSAAVFTSVPILGHPYSAFKLTTQMNSNEFPKSASDVPQPSSTTTTTTTSGVAVSDFLITPWGPEETIDCSLLDKLFCGEIISPTASLLELSSEIALLSHSNTSLQHVRSSHSKNISDSNWRNSQSSADQLEGIRTVSNLIGINNTKIAVLEKRREHILSPNLNRSKLNIMSSYGYAERNYKHSLTLRELSKLSFTFLIDGEIISRSLRSSHSSIIRDYTFAYLQHHGILVISVSNYAIEEAFTIEGVLYRSFSTYYDTSQGALFIKTNRNLFKVRDYGQTYLIQDTSSNHQFETDRWIFSTNKCSVPLKLIVPRVFVPRFISNKHVWNSQNFSPFDSIPHVTVKYLGDDSLAIIHPRDKPSGLTVSGPLGSLLVLLHEYKYLEVAARTRKMFRDKCFRYLQGVLRGRLPMTSAYTLQDGVIKYDPYTTRSARTMLRWLITKQYIEENVSTEHRKFKKLLDLLLNAKYNKQEFIGVSTGYDKFKHIEMKGQADEESVFSQLINSVISAISSTFGTIWSVFSAAGSLAANFLSNMTWITEIIANIRGVLQPMISTLKIALPIIAAVAFIVFICRLANLTTVISTTFTSLHRLFTFFWFKLTEDSDFAPDSPLSNVDWDGLGESESPGFMNGQIVGGVGIAGIMFAFLTSFSYKQAKDFVHGVGDLGRATSTVPQLLELAKNFIDWVSFHASKALTGTGEYFFIATQNEKRCQTLYEEIQTELGLYPDLETKCCGDELWCTLMMNKIAEYRRAYAAVYSDGKVRMHYKDLLATLLKQYVIIRKNSPRATKPRRVINIMIVGPADEPGNGKNMIGTILAQSVYEVYRTLKPALKLPEWNSSMLYKKPKTTAYYDGYNELTFAMMFDEFLNELDSSERRIASLAMMELCDDYPVMLDMSMTEDKGTVYSRHYLNIITCPSHAWNKNMGIEQPGAPARRLDAIIRPVRTGNIFNEDDFDSSVKLYSSYALSPEWNYKDQLFIDNSPVTGEHPMTKFPIRQFDDSFLLPLGLISMNDLVQAVAARLLAFEHHPHIDTLINKLSMNKIVENVKNTCSQCLSTCCKCCKRCHLKTTRCRCPPPPSYTSKSHRHNCNCRKCIPSSSASESSTESDDSGKDKETDLNVLVTDFVTQTTTLPSFMEGEGWTDYFAFVNKPLREVIYGVPLPPPPMTDIVFDHAEPSGMYLNDWYYLVREAILSDNNFDLVRLANDNEGFSRFMTPTDKFSTGSRILNSIERGCPCDPLTIGAILYFEFDRVCKSVIQNYNLAHAQRFAKFMQNDSISVNTMMYISLPGEQEPEILSLMFKIFGIVIRNFEFEADYYLPSQNWCSASENPYMSTIREVHPSVNIMTLSAGMGMLFMDFHKTNSLNMPDPSRTWFFTSVYNKSYWTRICEFLRVFWSNCTSFRNIRQSLQNFSILMAGRSKLLSLDFAYHAEFATKPVSVQQQILADSKEIDLIGIMDNREVIQEKLTNLHESAQRRSIIGASCSIALGIACLSSLIYACSAYFKTERKDELKLMSGQNYEKLKLARRVPKKYAGQTYEKLKIRKKPKTYSLMSGQYLPEKFYKVPKGSNESSCSYKRTPEGVFLVTSSISLSCQSDKSARFVIDGHEEYPLLGTNKNLIVTYKMLPQVGFRAKTLADFDPTRNGWWVFDNTDISLIPFTLNKTSFWILIDHSSSHSENAAYVMTPFAIGQMGTWNDLAKHKVRSVANNIFQYQLSSLTAKGQGYCFSPGGRFFVMTRHGWEYINEGSDLVTEFLIKHADTGAPLRFSRDKFSVSFSKDKRDLVFITVTDRHLPNLPSLKKRLRSNGTPPPEAVKVARVGRDVTSKNVEYHSLVFTNQVKRSIGPLNVGYSYSSDPRGEKKVVKTDVFLELPGAIGEAGDCGLMYVAFDSRTGIADIIGMHNGTYGGSGIIVPLYQEDFPLLGGERFDYTHYGDVSDLPDFDGQTSTETFPIVPGTRQLGITLAKQAFVPTRTILQPSVIYDDFEAIGLPIPVAPANLHPSVHAKTFEKLSQCSGIESLPPEIEEIVQNEMDEILEGWLPEASNVNFRMFSLEEALFSEDIENLTSMDLSKSPTYEMFVLNLKRSQLYGRDKCPNVDWLVKPPVLLADGKKWIHSTLRTMMDTLFSHIDSGGEIKCLSTACWKDELRNLEAVQNGKTRLFCIGSFTIAIACKMMFGDLVRTKTDLTIRPSKIGINPYSKDWHFLHAALCKHPNLFGGDCSGWDYKVRALFLYCFKKFIARLKIVPLHKLYMLALSDTVMGTYLVYGKFMIERLFGVCSGHWLTSYFNTFANFVAHKIVWILRNPDPANLSWNDHVYMAFYGDDNGGCCSNEVAPWFNMKVIAEVFSLLGMTYTTPDKGEVTSNFLNWNSFQFLSRKFEFSEEAGRVVAPLELSSIIGMLAYIRSPKAFERTPNEQLCINIDVACRELSLHNPKKTGKIYDFLSYLIRKHNLPMSALKSRHEYFRDVVMSA